MTDYITQHAEYIGTNGMQNLISPLYELLVTQRPDGEEGQTMTELALLVATVSIVLLVLVGTLATGVINTALDVASAFVQDNMVTFGS